MGYVPSPDARPIQFHSNHCILGAGELRFSTRCTGTLIVEPDFRENCCLRAHGIRSLGSTNVMQVFFLFRKQLFLLSNKKKRHRLLIYHPKSQIACHLFYQLSRSFFKYFFENFKCENFKWKFGTL